MMAEALYKTDAPEASVSDCYQVILEKKVLNDRHLYFVREVHGWWNDQEKRFIKEQKTLSPEDAEGYPTLEEATDRYNLQILTRAKSGFRHSFSPDPFGGKDQYRHIDIE